MRRTHRRAMLVFLFADERIQHIALRWSADAVEPHNYKHVTSLSTSVFDLRAAPQPGVSTARVVALELRLRDPRVEGSALAPETRDLPSSAGASCARHDRLRGSNDTREESYSPKATGA